MYPNCRSLLEKLCNLTNGTETSLAFDEKNMKISLCSNPNKYITLEKFEGQIKGTIYQLKEDKYIQYEDVDYIFHLTNKGLHRYWFSLETFKMFMIKSIVVPIIVALITTWIYNSLH